MRVSLLIVAAELYTLGQNNLMSQNLAKRRSVEAAMTEITQTFTGSLALST